MRYSAILTLVISVSLAWPSSSRAEGWLFKRSYYSHNPVKAVEIAKKPGRGPRYTSPSGAYVQGGYRRMRSTIVVGGQSYDHVNVFESWIQTGQQF